MGIDGWIGDSCAVKYCGEDFFKWVLTGWMNWVDQLLMDLSGAPTSLSETPNVNVALFDLAFPGSQPVGFEALDSRAWRDQQGAGISGGDPHPGHSGRNRAQLRDPARESVRQETLLLSRSACGVPDYTVLR